MKKLMILLAAVLIEINCSAQWVKKNVEGDDFAGTVSNTTYCFISAEANGSCAFYQTESGSYSGLIVSTNSGLFDYSSQSYGMGGGKVGFYDSNGNLIKKWGNRSFVITGNGKSATPWGLSDKVINYLLNEDGYVRIIVRKRSGNNLDIKIPCIGDIDQIEEILSVNEDVEEEDDML